MRQVNSMFFDSEVTLIKEEVRRKRDRTESRSRAGERKVYALKRSPSRDEFYRGAQAGLEPSVLFDVHSVEYENERLLEYEGIEFSVIKTYTRYVEGFKLTELTCVEKVGNRVR